MAMGSASEVEYQILLARDLGYVGPETCAEMEAGITEIKRMLASLIRKVRGASDHLPSV
jgi:four helix bundle protein